MTTRRRRRFIYAHAAWMGVGVVAVALLNGSVELFFVYSLIGLLALVELTSPVNVRPEWRNRLRWIVLAGLVGFGYIVIRESLRVLGIEVI